MSDQFKKAMIVSVGTGKEGKDIAHAICFSVQQQNPKLIVFLITNVSAKATMPYICEDDALKGKECKKVELEDPDDVEKIAIECQKIIQDLVEEGYEKRNIVVDYTSGTKAMSSGLSIAAIREKVGALVYTTGKRGEGGRVISGTERVLVISPNQIFVEDLFREAIESFNTYHFDITIQVLEEAKSIISDPLFHEKARTLIKLSKAYSSWDRFEIEKAFEFLKEFHEDNLLKEWGIFRQIELNKQALYTEKNNLFCFERIFDLLENAKRRGDEEHKFDDAVARLYRATEYLGQFRLNTLGYYKIKDGKPDLSDFDLKKLPSHLQEKYSKYIDDDGKVKIPLRANYNLLYDLKDSLGLYFKEKENKFKELLGLRNSSLLAHGFNPISERVYQEMLEMIESFIKTFGLNNDIRKKVKFPKINILKN